MKLIIESDIIYLQMNHATYHWTTELLQFYYDKEIRVINWLTYSPNLNQIKNMWAIMKTIMRKILIYNYEYSKIWDMAIMVRL